MKKKSLIMIILVVAICIMATGYALLQQQLTVSGSSSIESTWKIEIIDILEKEKVGDASSKITPSYTNTTANFKVGLVNPTDSITYEIKIKNTGTLDAKVDSYQVQMDENEAIVYELQGIAEGDKLASGDEVTLSIKVSFKKGYVGQPEKTTKNIKVIINYIQDINNTSTEIK